MTSAKQSFGQWARKAREDAGVTQDGIAEFAHLSTTGLAMIERGERYPSLAVAIRIVRQLTAVGADVSGWEDMPSWID